MNRKFLEELKIGDQSLTKEQIDSIMAENGKDVEVTKAKADKTQEIENLKTELATVNTKLGEANVQIEKFTGLDVEGIKKEADEWKNKYTEFENKSKSDKEAFEKQLQDQQYDFKVKEFVNSQKFTSDFAKKAFENEFKTQGFKIGEDGNFMGGNDYLKTFGEKNQGVFTVEEAPKEETKIPTLVSSTNNGQAPKAKMGLMEMMKLKNANPNAQIEM